MTASLRVDVAGVSIFVRSEFERRHLEKVNHDMARMKLALHHIARATDLAECVRRAEEALT